MLDDIEAYKAELDASVFKSALLMRPVFESARLAPRKIVFAEGEDERVLRAAQAVLEETTEHPILIGRPESFYIGANGSGLISDQTGTLVSSIRRMTPVTGITGAPITSLWRAMV